MGVELQRRFETMKNCFGQLETDVEWLEYQSSRSAFYTASDLPAVKPTGDLSGTLHLLCTGNQMHSLHFRVHVTHRNHHPPTFTHDQAYFSLESDGTVLLKEELGTLTAFKPIRMEVLAIDYGSPQLFTLANVTIVPVTVSPIQNLRVNVATEDYQIFEWEAPSYGHPDKYRLAIAKGESMHYEEELDSRRTVALTKVAISPSGNFTFKVTAVDANGETPSEWQRFTVFQNDNCQPEKTIDTFGGLDWREASANATIQVPCPYNTESDKQKVERSCEWNKQLGRAVWARQKEVDKCKTQSSVLTHLGMLGTFAQNANGVSTIHTVARFIRDLLSVPAFSTDPTATAHFDQRIAEHAALVIDSAEMWSILSEFSDRLPSPFTLVSSALGLHLKSMQWVKDSENFDSVLGTKCRVKETFFFDESDALRDLGVLLPTVTTFISMICSIFLLFMAAVQKNNSVDFAMLVYLFFVFMILVVGDPFALSPALHLILQFSILSVTATLYLVLRIDYTLISQLRLFRVFERIDWLFLINYLSPTVLFCALCFSYAVWNIYLGSLWRSRHRGSSDRFLSLTPSIQASLVSLPTLIFLGAFVVLFVFRERSTVVAIVYSLTEILMRYLFEREEDGSTQSLERKRDISRALLDHVDVAKSNDENNSMRSDSGSPSYYRMPQNLYDRAPMVSIV
ncbi:unnamed protein product [Nippostrongylus brasiliensis]|uniref:Fibronectin type-III domain-containing protein n=1 Tax=Nippostrongylus brasiliensis TaxID=27835 RepID=A0A158R2A2_NIPBR|nr:unnamed protein product [Nippostrongylus brasiliensis]